MTRLLATVATLLLLTATASSSLAAEVRATLSTREAYVGNPITLRIEIANANSHEAPQVPQIDGVNVRSVGTPNRSSQVTIINGRRTERTSLTYAWQLIPREAGTYTIPGISVEADGRQESTRPLRFVATKSETGDLLFAEIVGDEEHIFVGQPMKLTLRVWIRPYSNSRLNVALDESDMWQMISQEKSNWGIFTERLNKMAENRERPAGREVLRADSEGNDRRYYLYDIDATVYPKRAGQIDGDEVQIVVDYPTRLGKSRDPFDSFFDRSGIGSMFGEMPSMFGPRLQVTDARPIVASAKVRATDVLPIPTADRPADYRGAVGRYKMNSQASPTQVKAGDPITLHLGIQGDGPMYLVQAPPLSMIPEIAADFKVADDPLAGVVQDDVKLFTASVRPRSEGITQIPAIPFSYFDPTEEKFVTVYSDPIEITVEAADRLVLDSIEGFSKRDPLNAESNTASQQPVLHLENFSADEILNSDGEAAAWARPTALLFAPLVCLAVACIRFRDRLSGLGFARKQSKAVLAKRQIRTATTPEEVASAVKTFVAEHRYLIDDDLTSSDDDSNSSWTDIVRRCEFASFAGAGELSDREMETLRQDATECVNRFNQELGRTALQPNATKAKQIAAVASVVLALAFCLVTDRTASAAEFSDSQKSQLLVEAEEAYLAGVALAESDTAESKQSFAIAATKYQSIVDTGVVSEKLYFNLGNAYLRSGSLGHAIASYELAINVNPDSIAKTNLEHARSLLAAADTAEDISMPSTAWTDRLMSWNAQVPNRIRFWLGCACWSLLWLCITMLLIARGKRWKPLMIPAAILASLCLTSWGVERANAPGDRAVVVAEETQPREGNGDAFASTAKTLTEGAMVEVLERRGDWLKTIADGRVCWISGEDIVFIEAGGVEEPTPG